MRYLIDGYNLMHALLGPPASGPHGLEHARYRLLDRLHSLPRVEPGLLTIVFDAQHGPVRLPRELDYRGMHLHFPQGRTADDLIEDLLKAERHPEMLTVISNDHRVQNAAKRRSCLFLDCLDWVDQMEKPRPAERPPTSEKPVQMGDNDEWLRTFSGIDTTELNDPQAFN